MSSENKFQTIPLGALALQAEDKEGKIIHPTLAGTVQGSIKNFPMLRNTHYKTVSLSLETARRFELVAENIDGFTVLEIEGFCELYTDEPLQSKRIPIGTQFSYKVTASKLYISNESQTGRITLVLDRLMEVG